MKYLMAVLVWTCVQVHTLKRWPEERRLRKRIHELGARAETLGHNPEEIERLAMTVVGLVFLFALTGKAEPSSQEGAAPKFGEYLLYLFLSKKDREYLIGDLAEEYLEVRAKFGRRWADVWYYKQVAASAWPMIRKAVGWGLLASIGTWLRRII